MSSFPFRWNYITYNYVDSIFEWKFSLSAGPCKSDDNGGPQPGRTALRVAWNNALHDMISLWLSIQTHMYTHS